MMRVVEYCEAAMKSRDKIFILNIFPLTFTKCLLSFGFARRGGVGEFFENGTACTIETSGK